MLNKEILNKITLDELKAIAKEWHRINDICNATPDGYKQFDVTDDDEWYTDRDIDGKFYAMRITTYKEKGKTVFSGYIGFYDPDCPIGGADIKALESFINEMEGA